MNCPSCQTTMREREKESVIVDVCPACHGMWLDHGELEKLVEIESEREGRYRRYYEDDDDDDDDDDRRSGWRDNDRFSGDNGPANQQPRRKRGFFANLMESLGGEGE